MRPTAWIAAVALSLTSLTSFAQGHEPNLPWRDLSQDRDRQVVIAAGTPDLYNGHPTTLLMDDGKTMLCTWSKGHGGDAAFLAFSYDAGLSWSVREAPAAWKGLVNCPSIYKLTDKQGKQRIFVFAQARCENKHRDMGYSVSEDGGLTWSPVKKLGKPCIMAFTSIIRLDNGDYLGMYHTGSPEPDHDASPLRLWQAVSHDGGLTWDPSELVGEFPGRSPCEPCVFRSPDGKKLVCIARENQRVGNSLMMTSEDEGKTWTPMYESPWGLTGDRHVVRYLPDGRLIAVFRDMAPHSPTKGNFVAWVGTCQDALWVFPGQYRVKLLHSYAAMDCGYPGLEILPDGTLIATTYIKYHPGAEKHSVVSVRFKAEDLDALFPFVSSCTQEGQDRAAAKPAAESAYRSVIRLWSVDHLSERIESELMDGFRRYPNACDEVWLLAEGNGGYFAPASDEELEKLKKAAADCRELGIIVSYQDLSLGHPDNIECPPGLNKYGFRAAIGANGKASYTQTCPRDTAFVRAYAQKYAQVCEAIRPDNVMIDDDLRLTLHGPSEIICFCDDCIARFNEEYGHRFNHESLVKALESNQPGIRSEWIEFSQYSLAYFAGQIAEAVHQVSPESHLGLQHVAFHANLMEGWDWNKIFDAMRAATGNTVSSRPGHGVYNDHAPRMIIEKAYGISRQIGRLEGDFHTIFPEIEGFEHRATGKSPQSICTETLLYLSMGANAMSYSLIGGNHEKMDWYADNYFKYLDRYHKLFCDYVAFNKGSEGAGIDDYISPSLVLRDEPGWMNTDAGRTSITLSPLGIPFTPEAKRCTASILDAQNIAGMGSEEIAAFLSENNVILDARGWDKVMERGLQSLFKKVDIPEGLPQDTGCFETQGSKRAVILGKPFRYDISAAQRQELLRAFDWASEGRMSVFPETFSQCVTVPRVDSESGLLRSVTYVNATITDQENITLRLRSCPGKAKFRWEDVKGSHRLKAVRDGDDVLVTIPFIKAWDAGWIRIE